MADKQEWGRHWDKLKGNYNARKLVLVVGAGVSKDSGIPDWRELLRGTLQVSPKEFIALEEHLTLPAIASLAEWHCGSHRKFVDRIRQQLYEKFPYKGQDLEDIDHEEFRTLISAKNPSLGAVASMCLRAESKARKTGSVQFGANPKLRAVVTLNLDSLLKNLVKAISGKGIIREIERASAHPVEGMLNLYHMHGLLRFDKRRGDPRRECDQFVMTEKDYYDFFNNPSSIFSYTFLHLLREYHCLFIGLSMRDENLRRMLHLSRRDQMDAYRAEGKEKDAKKKTIRHFAILDQTGRTMLVKNAIKETLRELGTRVIWVKGVDKVPRLLQDLYEASGKDSWKDVHGPT